MERFKKLEDGFEGVNLGDMLLLQAENNDIVSGFVHKLTLRTVKLSHESPNNECGYGFAHFPRLTIGNRKYHLSDFKEYKVIDLNLTSE